MAKWPWDDKGEKRILRTLEALMATADEIRAAQAQQSAHLDGLQASVDQVQADVDELLRRLGEAPGIPQDILDAANAVNTRLAALRGDVEATPRPPSA